MKRAKNAKAEMMMMVIFLPLNRKFLLIEFLNGIEILIHNTTGKPRKFSPIQLVIDWLTIMMLRVVQGTSKEAAEQTKAVTLIKISK